MEAIEQRVFITQLKATLAQITSRAFGDTRTDIPASARVDATSSAAPVEAAPVEAAPVEAAPVAVAPVAVAPVAVAPVAGAPGAFDPEAPGVAAAGRESSGSGPGSGPSTVSPDPSAR